MLSFLQSLHLKVSGVNKIWVIYKVDEEIFERGYQRVVDCMSTVFDIEMVQEEPGRMGESLKQVLEIMTSQYVIIAVDEIIWLRPVNVTHIGCIMAANRNKLAAAQLRLGFNVNLMHMKNVPHREQLFHDLSPQDGILAYYPLRLPYDFGYITHVDGLLMHRDDVIDDLSPFKDIVHPNRLEHRWLYQNIYKRSRQWHLMYNESRMVNNALKQDGRVLDKATPGDGSFTLAEKLLDEE